MWNMDGLVAQLDANLVGSWLHVPPSPSLPSFLTYSNTIDSSRYITHSEYWSKAGPQLQMSGTSGGTRSRRLFTGISVSG